MTPLQNVIYATGDFVFLVLFVFRLEAGRFAEAGLYLAAIVALAASKVATAVTSFVEASIKETKSDTFTSLDECQPEGAAK